ncbi:MAG: hypothetical protein JWQ83_1888, partial [Lacunisphaera sp.]|nr:hypothetical protein [Lacunisphaera sp.]
MPQRSQPWFLSGLRFCGSCLATVLCWALWLVLGTTLVALAYIAVAKELPVPGFVLRRVETEMAKANLTIRFGRASLEPTGQLLLEDVQLHSKQFADPLVRSRLVYVRRSIWSVLGGRPVPDEIRLEGATLQLPAMLSPSGVAEPLVRDFAATVRHQDNVWEISQLIGRIGPLAVTAQGAITVPARPAGAAPFSLEEMVTRYLQFSRQLALGIHRLDALENPALSIRLENPEGIGNIGTLLLTARGLHLDLKEAGDLFANLPLTSGPLAATTTIRLDGPLARTMRLHAAVREAGLGADYRIENVRAILSAQLSPEGFAVHPVSAWIAAGTVSAEGESARGSVLQADLANWPDVRTTVMTQIRGEYLAAEVEAALTKKTARIRAEGRASAEAIDQVLARHLPRAAPFFVFADPVNFIAEAKLGPEWKFASLASRVDAGRIDSRGVKLTAARGRIDIAGMDFLAHDARLELGDCFARGSYGMNFATT